MVHNNHCGIYVPAAVSILPTQGMGKSLSSSKKFALGPPPPPEKLPLAGKPIRIFKQPNKTIKSFFYYAHMSC